MIAPMIDAIVLTICRSIAPYQYTISWYRPLEWERHSCLSFKSHRHEPVRQLIAHTPFMKIRLVMLGKTRRPEVRMILDDYVARIRRFAEVQLTELREDSAASLRKLALDSAAT